MTTDKPGSDKPQDQLSGPQGVDKAPGEDAADHPEEGLTIQDSQKAKKVDADPQEENKKPAHP
ncbi:hypothetical protein GWC95_18005 [Sediminibacterium roseum]|uniref:Uncharacterized protein n=1 Tax=Sediminibacterium roseum TaxID=1978412 RepID=A0ABW9ZXD0_9BACT|nr:hypothetical protein [Sediminibacterium roseum]NCI51824.1 hypothetical protein [Sediminibacterium roseum]